MKQIVKIQEAYLRNKTGLERVEAPLAARELMMEQRNLFESCMEINDAAVALLDRAGKMSQASGHLHAGFIFRPQFVIMFRLFFFGGGVQIA
jgi:hypothetical protein